MEQRRVQAFKYLHISMFGPPVTIIPQDNKFVVMVRKPMLLLSPGIILIYGIDAAMLT